jgi:hypothetical protein
VPLLFYPVDDRRLAVEVGSSRMVADRLCTSTLQVAHHCTRGDGDGDCNIMVAGAGGRRSLVVVLLYA